MVWGRNLDWIDVRDRTVVSDRQIDGLRASNRGLERQDTISPNSPWISHIEVQKLKESAHSLPRFQWFFFEILGFYSKITISRKFLTIYLREFHLIDFNYSFFWFIFAWMSFFWVLRRDFYSKIYNKYKNILNFKKEI